MTSSKITSTSPYDQSFYNQNVGGSLRSARVVVPLVLELTGAKSVVDFGCGVGTWLKAFQELGVQDYVGIDGDHVDLSQLLIPVERFRATDLERAIELERRFDLAICLEVAEHLPTSSSCSLVQSLVAAAPLVLFSAAVPGQGGTHHVNERWPWYWEKQFLVYDYIKLDPIRPAVWQDPLLEWWYAQNTVVYAAKQILPQYALLSTEYARRRSVRFELVNEDVLRRFVDPSLRTLIKQFPETFLKFLRRRIEFRGWR